MDKEKKLKAVKYLVRPNCEASFAEAAERGYTFDGYSEYSTDGVPRIVEFVKLEHEE